MNVVVMGGGAAGFLAAITCAEAKTGGRVVILEKGSKVLAKVRVSGGGRCNVTHACFEPALLAQSYPRGGRALLGPFHYFQPRDIVEWFKARGVALKTEPDGRIFPTTDKSETIVNALTHAAKEAGVAVRAGIAVASVARAASSRFVITLNSGETISCDRLLLATGSGPQGYELARGLGHAIEQPVASLFTFNISDARLKDLAGISVPLAQLKIEETKLKQTGPMLITHWGLSGPAVLKLSAWGARTLHALGYRARLRVNWLGISAEEAARQIGSFKASNPKKLIVASCPFDLPRRLWERLVTAAGLEPNRAWANLSKVEAERLKDQLTGGTYDISGKSPFKEEFVTCGGVNLGEVDFKTMESKLCPGLYFAGEILDIDGVTGGFNFQSAWTTGWLAGRAMAAPLR
ncbi:MAG: NAD(P)/FAD-dependent oxidoreductase [Elusimicrobia bacterium]|nr:NAD(P)/FAD-dependent oxidoreductase [Elusimicrobiota bacterium]